MVRKRLEDLVRQEAQKSLKPEDEAVGAEATEQTIELEATVVPETDSEQSPASAKRTNLTKADLETTLKELKAALQAAESDNNSWQQKTDALQSELENAKTLVEKLQVELNEAKQLILKLTESNSPPPQKQYSSPAQTQYSPPAQTQYSPPAQTQYSPPAQTQYSPPAQTQYSPPAQTQYSPPAQTQYSPPAQRENMSKKSQDLSLRKIPYHSIQESSPSTEMTNSDIGWFD